MEVLGQNGGNNMAGEEVRGMEMLILFSAWDQDDTSFHTRGHYNKNPHDSVRRFPFIIIILLYIVHLKILYSKEFEKFREKLLLNYKSDVYSVRGPRAPLP